MRTMVLLFLLANLPDMASPQQNPSLDQDKRSEDVVKRGEHVMGFSHEATTHHFRLFKDGGEIAVNAKDRNDDASIEQIRMHLGHIAKMFSSGISKPPWSFTIRNQQAAKPITRSKEKIRNNSQEPNPAHRIGRLTASPETRNP